MKNKLIIVFLFCGLSFIGMGQVFAQSASGLVDKANKLYKQGKYDDSLKLYNQADSKLPESSQISYNTGLAQFKKGDYGSAIASFEKAASGKDRFLEAKANYNIANAKYKQAKLKENTNLGQTVELLRQSLDYYKRAIELNPKDEDAKVNHELVEKELKILLDKLKQQQAGQKQPQEQKQGQSQESEEKNDERQASGEKEEAKTAQAKQAGEEKKDESQEIGGSSQEIGGKEDAQPEKEMSKQEAMMLLDGYRQQESSLDKVETKGSGRFVSPEKDW